MDILFLILLVITQVFIIIGTDLFITTLSLIFNSDIKNSFFFNSLFEEIFSGKSLSKNRTELQKEILLTLLKKV